MIKSTHTRRFLSVLFLALAALQAAAQFLDPVRSGPMNPFTKMDLWINTEDKQKRQNELGSPDDSVSKFDLQAPSNAKREYNKGLQLLLRKQYEPSRAHLEKSVTLYPAFVAAHNALGSAYLDQQQNEKARAEFALAVSIDDHLPRSYMNLGRAELMLRHYAAAEAAMRRACALSPLDLHSLTALAYTQFLSQQYQAAVSTAALVHARKHEGAAMVHYFAAASWQAQNNLDQARNELETFLAEDSSSAAAPAARDMLAQIANRQNRKDTAPTVSYAPALTDSTIKPGEISPRDKKLLQELQQQTELSEAECEACESTPPSTSVSDPPATSSRPARVEAKTEAWTLRRTVDEVAVFFAATDHGSSITDLTPQDVQILDDGKLPAALTGFRNQAQLPLRIGLLIDTSASVTSRFAFEQGAAADFLQRVLTKKEDLAFVVGFANSILLAQDYTNDQGLISGSIKDLAPAGGTALWDAVAFAAGKLASRPEDHPVARILVVISDGDDNSSTESLKKAIQEAERNEVIVYSVSTREPSLGDDLASVGNRSLKLLAERTGGAAFFPGSLGHLKRKLGELEEVIRSRYLLSYKPAEFQPNGQFRTIAIKAQKSGIKLRVYARKGYYANGAPETAVTR